MNYITSKVLTLLCLSAMMGVSACGFVNDNNSGPSASRNAPLEVDEDIVNSKLAAPKGFVSKNLFSSELNTDDRLDRLENVVQQLHDSLSGHMPAIQNISEIDGEIQDLIEQLKTLVNEPAPAVVAQPPMDVMQQDLEPIPPASTNASEPMGTSEPTSAPTPITKAVEMKPIMESTSKVEPKPVPVSGAATIQNIRVSEGGGKTRIVFDSNKMIDYGVDYDQQEGLLLVSAAGASVSADLASAARKSNKITSISQSNDGGTLNLIFSVSGVASVGEGTLLKPNKDSPLYRYFFDIR